MENMWQIKVKDQTDRKDERIHGKITFALGDTYTDDELADFIAEAFKELNFVYHDVVKQFTLQIQPLSANFADGWLEYALEGFDEEAAKAFWLKPKKLSPYNVQIEMTTNAQTREDAIDIVYEMIKNGRRGNVTAKKAD